MKECAFSDDGIVCDNPSHYITSKDYDQKREVFHRPNIGTVYMGALDPYQMLETFAYELRKQRPLHDDHRRILDAYKQCPNIKEWPVVAWSLLYGMSDALNTYAPKGFYFGASETTKGEYGFYPSPVPVMQFASMDGL